ncbi:hypothetical protein TIFTF001_018664 [Ficus carica]|uniref:Uncharacterized protein n=1 Tax=Ficus carica TaxID=3494 RepID=A0AA88ANP0_FICCA|nr:hypothetical protein TIFTF001_018664 [Ficus carica]
MLEAEKSLHRKRLMTSCEPGGGPSVVLNCRGMEIVVLASAGTFGPVCNKVKLEEILVGISKVRVVFLEVRADLKVILLGILYAVWAEAHIPITVTCLGFVSVLRSAIKFERNDFCLFRGDLSHHVLGRKDTTGSFFRLLEGDQG